MKTRCYINVGSAKYIPYAKKGSIEDVLKHEMTI